MEVGLSSFPIDAKLWQEGVALEKYVTGMQANQADMRRRIAQVRLSQADAGRLCRVERPVIKVTALSEDWCIDCLMTLPIMAQIAACVPGMELHIFSRSKYPLLKEYYNCRGIMSIPAYSFLDENFVEFATFIERPQLVYQKVDAWKAAHPEADEVRRSATMSSDEKSARLAEIRRNLQCEMEEWYVKECQSAMVAEVAALLGV
jgi:hypothetical protein